MVRKVLILRPGAMGDVCMAVPLVAALARQCEVHWLLHRVYMPIPRAFHADCRLIPLEPRPSSRALRSLAEPCVLPADLLDHLKREHFDAVLDLAHWPITAQLVHRLADNVPVRAITFDPQQDERLGVNPHRIDLYAPFNVRASVVSAAHQVRKWQALVRAALNVELPLDWPLASLPPRAKELHVFVHPHASKPEKAWPAHRFAQVLRGLSESRPVRCFINSGSRRELLNALALWFRLRTIGIRAEIVWLDRSCSRLQATLAQADFALGCDSGPMHFASLLGIPSVVLFGPYTAEEFGPLWRSIPVSPRGAGMPARSVPASAVLHACRRIADDAASLGTSSMRRAA
jgi:ADP-heptose:LPS heptosyltransferase